MKIWEKIKIKFNDIHFDSRENIKYEMYKYRVTPCELEYNHNILINDMNYFKQLINCNSNCKKCLDKYLDLDIEKYYIEKHN